MKQTLINGRLSLLVAATFAACLLPLGHSPTSRAASDDGGYHTEVKLTPAAKGTYRVDVKIDRIDDQGKRQRVSAPAVICSAGHSAVIQTGTMGVNNQMKDGIRITIRVPKGKNPGPTQIVSNVYKGGTIVHTEHSEINTPQRAD